MEAVASTDHLLVPPGPFETQQPGGPQLRHTSPCDHKQACCRPQQVQSSPLKQSTEEASRDRQGVEEQSVQGAAMVGTQGPEIKEGMRPLMACSGSSTPALQLPDSRVMDQRGRCCHILANSRFQSRAKEHELLWELDGCTAELLAPGVPAQP